ncbi:DUF1285 domain-containing protein [Methylovirgula sp. 4M-Z18]|uniref:DUF1285 domain-containing protein n=1 Tax=Methylovirgula sp. 4M-Z18 TaxID=2293567 RepID=UPI000E2F28C4|nr:DUF1285 domain-containing protein [Methylovirgula sp. 4M-Z18]
MPANGLNPPGSMQHFDTLLRAATVTGKHGLPPVHLWNPPDCGNIDMRIAADGTWFYQKTPIGRPALVRLFSTILRKDPERYVLVTPVERVGIVVDDAPFLGVEMRVEQGEKGQTLHFRTNVDDWTMIDAAHPLRFELGASAGLKPYFRVRADLWALVKRALFYDLVDLGEVREIDGTRMFGVASAGSFFPMVPADEIGVSA